MASISITTEEWSRVVCRNPVTLQESCLQVIFQTSPSAILKFIGGNNQQLEEAHGTDARKWIVISQLLELLSPATWNVILKRCRDFSELMSCMVLLSEIRCDAPALLTKLYLSDSNLTDSQLEFLMSGNGVVALDIHNCPKLTKATLVTINEYGNQMVYLRVGNSVNIFQSSYNPGGGSSDTTSHIWRKPPTFVHDENCVLKTLGSKLKTGETSSTSRWNFQDCKAEPRCGLLWPNLHDYCHRNDRNIRIRREFERCYERCRPGPGKGYSRGGFRLCRGGCR